MWSFALVRDATTIAWRLVQWARLETRKRSLYGSRTTAATNYHERSWTRLNKCATILSPSLAGQHTLPERLLALSHPWQARGRGEQDQRRDLNSSAATTKTLCKIIVSFCNNTNPVPSSCTECRSLQCVNHPIYRLLEYGQLYRISYTAVRSIFAVAQFLPHIAVTEVHRAPKLGRIA